MYQIKCHEDSTNYLSIFALLEVLINLINLFKVEGFSMCSMTVYSVLYVTAPL